MAEVTTVPIFLFAFFALFSIASIDSIVLKCFRNFACEIDDFSLDRIHWYAMSCKKSDRHRVLFAVSS